MDEGWGCNYEASVVGVIGVGEGWGVEVRDKR